MTEKIQKDLYEKELEELLCAALRQAIRQCNSSVDGTIYSGVVSCDSGYVSMGVAFNTLEWLEEKKRTDPTAPIDYLEVHVAEWKEINYAYPFFKNLNEKIEELLELAYDSNFDSQDLTEVFIKVVTRAIERVNFPEIVDTKYKERLLLGMQFSDPSIDDWWAVLEVSKVVNTDLWHQKVASVASGEVGQEL